VAGLTFEARQMCSSCWAAPGIRWKPPPSYPFDICCQAVWFVKLNYSRSAQNACCFEVLEPVLLSVWLRADRWWRTPAHLTIALTALTPHVELAAMYTCQTTGTPAVSTMNRHRRLRATHRTATADQMAMAGQDNLNVTGTESTNSTKLTMHEYT
jgi:hypothetical protein